MEDHSGQGGANAGKTTSAQERRKQYFAIKNSKKSSAKKLSHKSSDKFDYLNPDWDPFT